MRATGAGVLLAIALFLCAAGAALAQPAEQQTTVLHLSQTAERNAMRDLLRIDLRVEETAGAGRSHTSVNSRADRSSRCRKRSNNNSGAILVPPASRQVRNFSKSSPSLSGRSA